MLNSQHVACSTVILYFKCNKSSAWNIKKYQCAKKRENLKIFSIANNLDAEFWFWLNIIYEEKSKHIKYIFGVPVMAQQKRI